MKHHRVEARSEAWHQIRLGIPTASEFHCIVTAGGKLSTQSEGYMHRLLAELMLGHPLDTFESPWMVRGQELEDSAISAYEFHTLIETDLGGFVTNDDGTIGCSPDRLVGADGLLEMKCPAPNTHVGYLLDPQSLEGEKRPQVQGQMYVCERQWVDLMSYHPEMPPVIRRVKRDEKYIGLLHQALAAFVELKNALRLKLEQTYGPFKPVVIPAPVAGQLEGDFDVTAEDVAAMIAMGQVQPEAR